MKMRKVREAAGLTLRQAADAIGVSVPYLSEVERGSRRTLTYKRAMAADLAYESGNTVLALSVSERMPWLSPAKVDAVCKIIA